MRTTIDIKPMLADGWEAEFLRDIPNVTYTESGYREFVGVSLRKQLPLEMRDDRLLGCRLSVYGTNPQDGREYRFPAVEIRVVYTGSTPDDLLSDQRWCRYVARSVGPFYPATPFDGFLIAAEQSDPAALAGLVDHLTELHGEGRIRFGLTPEHNFRYLGWVINLLDSRKAVAEVRRAVVNVFGGSRTLPPVTHNAR